MLENFEKILQNKKSPPNPILYLRNSPIFKKILEYKFWRVSTESP